MDADIIATTGSYFSSIFDTEWKLYHLRGFNEESIKEFITGSINNIKMARDIAVFLHTNSEVAELCRLPQVCSCIVKKLSADKGLETGALSSLLYSLKDYMEHMSRESTIPRVPGEQESVLSTHDESLFKLSALASEVCLEHKGNPVISIALKEKHQLGDSEFSTGLIHEKWDILPKPRQSFAFANKMMLTLLAAIHFANRWRSRDLNHLSNISFLSRNLTLLQFIFGILTTEDGHNVIRQINPQLSEYKLKSRAKDLVSYCVEAFRSCCPCGIDKTCCFGCKKPNRKLNDTNLRLFLVYLVRESQMPYLVEDVVLSKKTLEFCYAVDGKSCGVSLTSHDCREIARYMKQAGKRIKRIRYVTIHFLDTY